MRAATPRPTGIDKTVRLHPAQAAFRNSTALYRGFIAGRGSGKSWAGAYDLIRRSKRGRTYLVCGPTYPMLRDSSLRSFLTVARDLNVIDPSHLKTSPPPEIRLSTGADILFRSADDPERLRGPNYSGAWLDEASLMPMQTFEIVIASLREAGEQGWLSATFTPKGQAHWTYEVFGKHGPDTELFHARTFDNPFLPPEFAEAVARQYGEGAFALQELGGEWVDDEDEFQIIPTAWVKLAQQRWIPDYPAGERLSAVGVDVARGGADQTILAPRRGVWFSPLERHPGTATPDGDAVAALVHKTVVVDAVFKEDVHAAVNVDVVGVGSSAYDACRRLNLNAWPVNGAAKPFGTDRNGVLQFLNLRAYAYWSLREALDPVHGDGLMLPADPELVGDLTAARWEPSGRGIKVESKDDIRERLGRSPDAGDAIVLAWLQAAAQNEITVVPRKPAAERRHRTRNLFGARR